MKGKKISLLVLIIIQIALSIVTIAYIPCRMCALDKSNCLNIVLLIIGIIYLFISIIMLALLLYDSEEKKELHEFCPVSECYKNIKCVDKKYEVEIEDSSTKTQKKYKIIINEIDNK